MAVLIEALSVIYERDWIESNVPGGVESFKKVIPNNSLCIDGHLVRVGFLSDQELELFQDLICERTKLERYSLPSQFVDHIATPPQPNDWLEIGFVEIAAGHPVRVARRVGDQSHVLMTPEGWSYIDSLTQRMTDSDYDLSVYLLERKIRSEGVEGARDAQYAPKPA